MSMFIIQSILLLTIAFVLGCIAGALLHRLFVGTETASVAVEEAKSAPVLKESVEEKPQPKPKAKPKAQSQSKSKPKPKTQAKPKSTPKPKPGVASAKDDLKRIRGIGPQNEARLNSAGITTFAEIAGWSAKDQRELGERLSFPGRIEREEWVKQAKVLAKGGKTEFAKRVDKGEVESSQGKAAATETGKKPPVLAKAPAGGGDDLTLIEGVGNALERKLHAIGIYTFAQVSKWNADQQAWIGTELGFPGRPERENWTSEAAKLAKGGGTGKAKKSDRGEIKTRRKARI